MRIARITAGVLALLWGFLQAPFDHIHPEELEPHASSAPAHIHLHETLAQHSQSVAPVTDDDDEVDVPWSATPSAHIALPMDTELGERITLPSPARTSGAILVPWHRGHDPPESSPKVPRAPPA